MIYLIDITNIDKIYLVGQTFQFLCKLIGCEAHGPRREKTCLRGFANNTGADQPAHPRSLISAFVIRFLESIICILATGEIAIFRLVSVAEETGLKLALSETPKTGFLATRPTLRDRVNYNSYLQDKTLPSTCVAEAHF